MLPLVHLLKLRYQALVRRLEIVLEKQPFKGLVDLERVIGLLEHQEFEEVGLEVLLFEELDVEVVLVGGELFEADVVLVERVFDRVGLQEVVAEDFLVAGDRGGVGLRRFEDELGLEGWGT